MFNQKATGSLQTYKIKFGRCYTTLFQIYQEHMITNLDMYEVI